jgi:NADPH:quinone reductase-like Zn-dependent oxidoreductase
MKAIQIQAFGKPTDVAQCVDIADVEAPEANEVVIALEASPINQYDLLMIAGGYGYRPPLPAIVGTEGVGRVIAVGSGVKHLKEGDRTLEATSDGISGCVRKRGARKRGIRLTSNWKKRVSNQVLQRQEQGLSRN